MASLYKHWEMQVIANVHVYMVSDHHSDTFSSISLINWCHFCGEVLGWSIDMYYVLLQPVQHAKNACRS